MARYDNLSPNGTLKGGREFKLAQNRWEILETNNAAPIIAALPKLTQNERNEISTAIDALHASGAKWGVNYAWLEFGTGRNVWNHIAPTGPVQNLIDNGCMLFRVPFKWHMVQPTLLGELDTAHVACITSFMDQCAGRGAKVILDCHSYAGYVNVDLTSNKLGDGVLLPSHLADLWRRLALLYKDHAGLAGYDLMNEPNNMVNQQIWPTSAQAAINAIRTVDTVHPIYVEGEAWANSHGFAGKNPNLHTLTDPNNNLIFSAHCYLDRDASGQHYSWETEVAAGVTDEIGVQRIGDFVAWLNTYGYKGHIGELGVGQSAGWLNAFQKTCDYIAANNLELSAWSAGHMWGTYDYSLEPDVFNNVYRSKPQIGVMRKAWGEPGGDMWDSGSLYGTMNQPTVITIGCRGYLASPLTINIAMAGAAIPSVSSITLAAGVNPQTSYTLTSASNGSSAVTYSRVDGGPVPASRGFTVGGSALETAGSVRNCVCLWREVSVYTGPCVRLRRVTDNVEQDFGFTGLGRGAWVDVTAITAWAGASELRVVIGYDQSGNLWNLRAIDAIDSRSPTPAQQPIFLTNGGDGHPVMRWAGAGNTVMDMYSPIDGRTQLSTVAVHKPNGASDRLMSWEFMEKYVHDGSFSITTTAMSSTKGEPNNPTIPIAPTNAAWNCTATTHTCSWDGSGKRRGWKNGAVTGEGSNYISQIYFASRATCNIGWFRFYPAAAYMGDIVALIVSGVDMNATMSGYMGSLTNYRETYVAPAA